MQKLSFLLSIMQCWVHCGPDQLVSISIYLCYLIVKTYRAIFKLVKTIQQVSNIYKCGQDVCFAMLLTIWLTFLFIILICRIAFFCLFVYLLRESLLLIQSRETIRTHAVQLGPQDVDLRPRPRIQYGWGMRNCWPWAHGQQSSRRNLKGSRCSDH